MTRLLRVLACLTAALALPSSAQVFDSSGNGQLNGPYFFRELIYNPDSTGSLQGAVVIYGTIAFNANGAYAITGLVSDSSQGSGSYSPAPGTYSISSSGYGFLSHPYYSNSTLQVLVNKDKLVVGSSPDSLINDIFIAVPITSVNNATLNGAYSIAYYTAGLANSSTSGLYTNSYNSAAILNANAAGSITGAVSSTSYLGGNAAPIPDSQTGVSYSFSSNIGTLRFPTSGNSAIRGDRQMYISPDGNFIFGGTTISGSNSNSLPYDMFVGVRRGSTAAAPMNGLFYQIGLNNNPSGLDTYFGAFSAANGVILDHQRYISSANAGPVNYTAKGSFPTSATTDYTDSDSLVDYVVSRDSAIRIGTGNGLYLGIRVGLRTPDLASFTPPSSAPYIHPMGVTNTASYAAFTSGVAPGELINIYGANFADGTTQVTGGIQFPTTLDGVQVFINNRLAPLYFVTPGQIAAIVPYATIEPVSRIQVQRNGVLSNAVTSFVYPTGPGIFALSRNGVGPGAVLHANAPDYTVVSPAAPALVGEVVQVFVTGLGAVAPTIPEGGTGVGAEPFNRTLPSVVSAYVDNQLAEVTYSGLAPFLAGLYQVNVRIPAGASSGDVFLDIATPDTYTSQVTVNVAPAAAARTSSSVETQPFVRRR